jgi:phosphomannomutase
MTTLHHTKNLAWLDRLAVVVPGYNGYHRREHRRKAAYALRDAMIRRLEALKHDLREAIHACLEHEALSEIGAPLHEAARIMVRLPQKLVNVPVRDRSLLEDATAVWEAVARESDRLGDGGRILVRPSGTEPLVRIMVEAPTLDDCDAVCKRLAGVIANDLG